MYHVFQSISQLLPVLNALKAFSNGVEYNQK